MNREENKYTGLNLFVMAFPPFRQYALYCIAEEGKRLFVSRFRACTEADPKQLAIHATELQCFSLNSFSRITLR